MGIIDKDPPKQLLEQDQRLVGVDKFLLFVQSIDQTERMAIRLELKDDDGANGLTEDLAKVERACRLHNEGRARISSATTRPTSDGQRRVKCDGALPPKGENSKRKGSTVVDMEALIREAYESLKSQVEAEGKAYNGAEIEANGE